MFIFNIKKYLTVGIVIFILVVMQSQSNIAQTDLQTKSIFTVDFAKAKTGEYENYLEFLKLNWVEARNIALKKKQIKSFQLLILPKDEASDWHFVLITEYKIGKQYSEMEKNFAEIFKKNGVKLINGKSSRDMADIVISKELTSPIK